MTNSSTAGTAVVVGVGAEAGLGAALCRRFAREGLHVFVAGRTAERLARVVESIEGAGGRATAVVTDTTAEADVAQLFARAAPAGRLGFSWEPVNRQSADQAAGDPWTPEFRADVQALAARIAGAVHYAYRQGGASSVGACGPPGSTEYWCDGSVPGAAFTGSWAGFGSWDC